MGVAYRSLMRGHPDPILPLLLSVVAVALLLLGCGDR
jgi:hypothetical protein